MSRPPNRGRRRKQRRRLGLLSVGLIAVAAGSGFAHWSSGGFPARSEPLAGTPVELRIQDGVTWRELHAIRSGLRAAHRFMRRGLGRTVRGPVEGRIAREDHCDRSSSGDQSLIGEGRRGFICVDTSNVYWKSLISDDPVAASAIAAHEYVHVLQAELGCLPERGEQHYRWLLEGMASHVAWRALSARGRATEARVRQRIRLDGAFEADREPLRRYEREGGRTPQYALWHLAVRELVRDAVRAGGTPASRPERSLGRFCRRVGKGSPWRKAFARSFGLPVDRFYARFQGP